MDGLETPEGVKFKDGNGAILPSWGSRIGFFSHTQIPIGAQIGGEMRKTVKGSRVAVKGSRGRPAFKPTALLRRRVEEYVLAGMSHDAIAKALEISDNTLRKNFASELASGAQKRRAEIIGLLFASARKGNVAAQKKLEEMSRAVAQAEFTAPEKSAAAPTRQKPGKKEEAASTATSMLQDDEWGADLAISLGIDPQRMQ